MPAPAKDPVTGKFIPAEQSPVPNTDDTPMPGAEPQDQRPTGEEPPKADATPKDGKSKKTDLSGLTAFTEAFVGSKPAQAPKPGEKPAPTGKQPDGKPKVAKPAAPAKPKPAAPVTAQPLTAEQIAAATAEGVSRAMSQKPAEKKSESTEFKLSDEDTRRISVLERMGKLYPDQYKSLSEDYKKSKLELMAYAKQWQDQHPGEDFNEDDPEHQTFFESHNVDWEDEHYTEAMADLRADERVSQSESKINAKLSQMERQEKLKQEAPTIFKEQTDAGKTFWQAMGDDYADLLNEQGVADPAKLQALQQSDPEFALRVQAASALDFEVGELYKVMNGLSDLVTAQPAQNDPQYQVKMSQFLAHKNLSDFAMESEKRMMEQPEADRLNSDGKPFLTAEKYWALPEKQRRDYWTYSFRDLAALRAADLAEKVEKSIEQKTQEHINWAKARGIEVPDNLRPARNPNPAPRVNPTQQDEVEFTSPTAGAVSRMAASRQRPGRGGQTTINSFINRGI